MRPSSNWRVRAFKADDRRKHLKSLQYDVALHFSPTREEVCFMAEWGYTYVWVQDIELKTWGVFVHGSWPLIYPAPIEEAIS